MKYNDFIEILPNEIANKLNYEYTKTKVQNTSNTIHNRFNLPNILIDEKIIEILIDYNIILNTLYKHNFVNQA